MREQEYLDYVDAMASSLDDLPDGAYLAVLAEQGIDADDLLRAQARRDQRAAAKRHPAPTRLTGMQLDAFTAFNATWQGAGATNENTRKQTRRRRYRQLGFYLKWPSGRITFSTMTAAQCAMVHAFVREWRARHDINLLKRTRAERYR